MIYLLYKSAVNGKNIKWGVIMQIKRDYYIDELNKAKWNGFIKVITGIRRCGKSYLLNTLFYNSLLDDGVDSEHIITFSFENIEDLEKIDEQDSYFNNEKIKYKPFLDYLKSKINEGEKYYLLLDEIQHLERFDRILSSLLINNNLDIYVTGSNSKFLSSDIITEFAGRGYEIHIYPLSFKEFYDFKKGDEVSLLNEYMTYGGLPLVVITEDIDTKVKLLNSYLNEIYIKNIIKRYNLKQEEGIKDLLFVLASSISSLINPLRIKNTFNSLHYKDISEPIIKKYINILEESYLISHSLKYDVKGRKYISTPFKIYFEDVGIRNAALGFRQTEFTHLIENIIYFDLKKDGYSVDVGTIECREKDIRKYYEVDFVANKGSNRDYYQVAYSIPNEAKVEQEIRSLKLINDSFTKSIISCDKIPSYTNINGIKFINVYEYLLKKK